MATTTTKKTGVSNRHQQHKQYRSLVSYLKYFEGSEVTVELKNGRQWTGILMSAEDPSMNLVLLSPHIAHASATNTTQDTASSTTANAAQQKQTHIRGAAIRYINFTDDVMDTIRTGQDRERSAHQKYTRGVRKS